MTPDGRPSTNISLFLGKYRSRPVKPTFVNNKQTFLMFHQTRMLGQEQNVHLLFSSLGKSKEPSLSLNTSLHEHLKSRHLNRYHKPPLAPSSICIAAASISLPAAVLSRSVSLSLLVLTFKSITNPPPPYPSDVLHVHIHVLFLQPSHLLFCPTSLQTFGPSPLELAPTGHLTLIKTQKYFCVN